MDKKLQQGFHLRFGQNQSSISCKGELLNLFPRISSAEDALIMI